MVSLVNIFSNICQSKHIIIVNTLINGLLEPISLLRVNLSAICPPFQCLPFQQEFTCRNNRAAGKRVVNSNN